MTLRDGDFTHNVLTIGDPCVGYDDFPENVDSYVCQDGMTQNGIRASSGRLIYAVLHEALSR